MAEPDSIEVSWLTPDKPDSISVGRRRIADRLDENGFRVTLRGTTPRTTLAACRDEPDVFLGTTRAGAFAGAACSLRGVPFVVDHVDPIRQFAETNGRRAGLGVRLAEDLAFRRAEHVLYVYEEERRRVERHARAATGTDLGVAVESFADPEPSVLADARERLAAAGVSPEKRTAIYVGGLEPIYHVAELLDSMAHLDGWQMVVLGAGSLEERVERAGRCEDVHFLGSVAHEAVPGYLHAADVGLALVDDPHTLKVLEYGAAGLPVVGLRGRAEARFGGFVEYCDAEPKSIAHAVERAGEHGPDPAFREWVGQFDYDRVAATYGKVLKAVVRSHEAR